MNPSGDFNLLSLHSALDAQRQARKLTWAQALREINRDAERASVHPISLSTVSGLRTKLVAEADGVLQMLVWLRQSPESFMAGHAPNEVSARWPDLPSHQILRFDTRRLHAAINGRRTERKMTWSQVARETGVSAAHLTHLSKGGRTAFPQVMRMLKWLGRPAAAFTWPADR